MFDEFGWTISTGLMPAVKQVIKLVCYTRGGGHHFHAKCGYSKASESPYGP